jgi:ribosomal protein S8
MELNTQATNNAANMILFERIKTGNPILDTLVLTFLLSIVTGFLKWVNIHILDTIDLKYIFNYEMLCHYFSKKNVVEYEGKICCSTSIYDNQLHQSASFSDRFRALWDHIINNVEIDNNEVDNNELDNKTICVLLKHIEDNYLLNFEKISLSKRRAYYSDKKLINSLKAFNLSILSTRKGILSSTDCVDLKIGGFFLLNIS